MASLYRLYGLNVRSELPLPAPHSTAPDVDVDVFRGQNRSLIPATAPAGTLVSSMDLGSGRGTAFVEDNDGYLLRYFGYCECRVSKDLKTVKVHASDQTAPGIDALLLASSVLSFILCLRGVTVLHGSVVCNDRHALAFTGVSGQGKSTMAALLCGHGAAPLSDDVLALTEFAGGFGCFSGTHEIRLRPNAAELSRVNLGARASESADQRLALSYDSMTPREMPLAGIMIPQPSRTREQCTVTRLAPADALVALIRFPRSLGWVNHEIAARDLTVLARVVESVPVYTADIPWGPPFARQVAEKLLALLDNDGGARG